MAAKGLTGSANAAAEDPGAPRRLGLHLPGLPRDPPAHRPRRTTDERDVRLRDDAAQAPLPLYELARDVGGPLWKAAQGEWARGPQGQYGEPTAHTSPWEPNIKRQFPGGPPVYQTEDQHILNRIMSILGGSYGPSRPKQKE